jgi:nucleoside-diphosphate-sugar epimerase
MLKDPDEILLGYRDPHRNFLYIEDLLGLYMRVLSEWRVCRGETFCTGPDNALKIEDLADIIAEKLNWKGVIRWGTRPKRIGEIYYLNSTHAKARRILGWNPKTSLSDGLDKTIAHWKTQV